MNNLPALAKGFRHKLWPPGVICKHQSAAAAGKEWSLEKKNFPPDPGHKPKEIENALECTVFLFGWLFLLL